MKIETNLNLVSQFRIELMGIAAISIFMMHSVQQELLVCNYILYKPFELWGTFGVDVFCLLSGIGIYFSLNKNNDLMIWAKRRLKRVYVPYLIIAIIFNASILNRSVYSWLLRLSTLQYWFAYNDGGWYVSFILLMYCISAFAFSKRNKEKELSPRLYFLIVIAVLINMLLDVYNHFFYERYVHFLHAFLAYILGILLGEKNNRGHNIKRESVLIAVGAAIGALILRGILPALALSLTGIYKLGSSFLFVSVTSYLLDKVKKVKLLDKMGEVSLEFYLVHVYIIQCIKHYNATYLFQDYFIIWVLFFICSFAFAIIINKICKIIT